MTDLFENDEAKYLVLTNDEEQHSLWRERIDVPEGWTTRYWPQSMAAYRTCVGAAWTDMQPTSFARKMGQARPGGLH